MHFPENRLPWEPASDGIKATLAAAAAIAAEAGNQKNPDNPAAIVISAENAVAASVITITSTAIIVVAEEKQDDNPDPAVASASVVAASATAIVVASTVSSSQIAHIIASKGVIYGLFYAGRHVNVSYLSGFFIKRKRYYIWIKDLHKFLYVVRIKVYCMILLP